MKKISLIIIVWVGAAFVIRDISRVYTADKLGLTATEQLSGRKFDKALDSINKSLEINSAEPSYYRTRALIYISKGMLTEEKGFKELAYSDIEKSVSLNPDNLVTLRNCVPLFYFLASGKADMPAGKENWDPDYLKKTVDFYEMLKKKYGNDAGVVSLVAEYERKLGLDEGYGESREIVKKLRPDLLDWYKSFN